MTNCGGGVILEYNSIVNASNANIIDFREGTGQYGIYANYGSFVNAQNATVERMSYVSHGSIMNAHGFTGSLNQTPNIVTEKGIIFQEAE